MLEVATWTARKQLRHDPPPLVLIDSNILSFAITHETQWIETANGGHMARVPVYPSTSKTREYTDITFLTSLVHLAKGGHLHFRTSAELKAEREGLSRETFHDVGWMDFNLLSGLDMPSVDRRDREWIVYSAFGPPINSRERQAERLAASDDPIFRGLVSALGPSNTQDAWHLRTAHVHGCKWFLTMDYALIRNLTAQANNRTVKKLNVTAITPTDLGRLLRIVPVPPLMMSYEKSSWFVHPELHSPSERRRVHTPATKNPPD